MAYHSPKVGAALKLVERMTEKMHGRTRPGGPVASTLQNAQRIAASLESLEELARSGSPTETKEAHTLRIANAAKKLGDNLKQVSARFNDNTTEVYRNLSLQIQAATGLDTDSPLAPEIRSYFRGLSNEQRVEQMSVAIKARDKVTLSALLNGPDYLSGLTKEMQARYTEAYQREVAPDLVAELEAFNEVDAAAQAVLNVARQAVEQAYDPAYVDEILQKDAEAQGAQTRLAASLDAINAPVSVEA